MRTSITCAYATGFGRGLAQGGVNIVNGVINTAVEVKNTAVDVGHGAVTAASLLLCDEPIVFEAQSQALQALESHQVSSSEYYWRFGETVLTFGTNEQVRAAVQWWNGEITDDECSEIIGSTAVMQLAMAKSGKAMGKSNKATPKPARPAENAVARTPQRGSTSSSATQGVCFLADTIIYLGTKSDLSKIPLEVSSSKIWNCTFGGLIIIGCGIFFMQYSNHKRAKHEMESLFITKVTV